MEETDLSLLSEQEIMDMYSNVIESGQDVLIAKSCPISGYYWVGGNLCCRPNTGGGDCYHIQSQDWVAAHTPTIFLFNSG